MIIEYPETLASTKKKHKKIPKSRKKLSLLMCLSDRKCGADRKILLDAIIISKPEYNTIIFSWTNESRIESLNSRPNSELRMRFGVHRITPVLNLLEECNEFSLEYRRYYFSVNYLLSISTVPQNPAYNNIITNKRYHKEYLSGFHFTSQIYTHTHTYLDENKTIAPNVAERAFTHHPPWTLLQITVNTKLCQYKKKSH